jgi:hypothetical protein
VRGGARTADGELDTFSRETEALTAHVRAVDAVRVDEREDSSFTRLKER